MSKELYFEDFHVGQKFNSVGSYKVTAAEIKEFGEKYDPQPFHLDEAAGEGSSSTASPPPVGSPQPLSCASACSPSGSLAA